MSRLVGCPICHKGVSSTALRCTHCGQENSFFNEYDHTGKIEECTFCGGIGVRAKQSFFDRIWNGRDRVAGEKCFICEGKGRKEVITGPHARSYFGKHGTPIKD
jgi:hypothetical protein